MPDRDLLAIGLFQCWKNRPVTRNVYVFHQKAIIDADE